MGIGSPDGEGCFSIRQTDTGVWCGFGLEVRDDDAEIVEEIHRLTGFGTLSRRKRRGNDSPQISWKVQSLSDCRQLEALLDRYPLRAKKQRDYEIWKLALAEQKVNHQDRTARMLVYRETLKQIRKYR